MPIITYKKTDGMAHDLMFKSEKNIEKDDIVFGEGDALPNIETLHDANYFASLIKERATHEIQKILDGKAKELSFDSIHTAAVWTISKNPKRKARADALISWADRVWDFAEAELAKQEKGTPTYTKVADFIAALPKFTISGQE